ncbi:MAG: phosphatase PAP2 family protein [Planctomycetota bacterium]|jgi:membrane-associated phospholipid phosphatase
MRIFLGSRAVLRVFCSFLVLAAGCANPAEQAVVVSRGSFSKSLKNDLTAFPDRVIEEARDTFVQKNNICALLLAGGAGVAMHNGNADKKLEKHYEKHPVFSGFADESFDVMGHPVTHFAATGLWYAVSAENGNELNKQRAQTMMTAISITTLATFGLKAARDNETPNGQNWAWPSGHTASSFTVASVLDEFYGPKIAVPAYILAGLVGFRMVDTGDHWSSDIIFGAVLGWVVGHGVAGRDKRAELAGFKVLPYNGYGNGEQAIGISLVRQF